MNDNTPIPIHPTRGLDCHLCYCPNCGEESQSLTIGHLRKAPIHGREGQWVYANRGQTRKMETQVAAQGLSLGEWRDVPEYEKVPGALCAACDRKMEEARDEVIAGGAYWQCATCDQRGVLRANSVYAKAAREVGGVPAPQIIVVEFGDCERHTENNTA